MKFRLRPHWVVFSCLSLVPLSAEVTAPPSPATAADSAKALGEALVKLVDLVAAPKGGVSRTIALDLKLAKSDGLPDDLIGQTVSVAVRPPDHLKVTMEIDGTAITIGRRAGEMWIHVPSKKMGLVGHTDVPRFAGDPASVTPVKLDPIGLPVDKAQLALLPALLETDSRPEVTVDGQVCRVLSVRPTPAAREALSLPDLEIEATLRLSDSVPARLGVKSGSMNLLVDVARAEVLDPAPGDAFWSIPQRPGDTIETVALVHLTRFLSNFIATLRNHIPTLGPATGEKKLVASDGKGRLEIHDGTRVLFLQGTPEEMGHQHGVLLRNEIRDVTDRILYGVGVGSSFAKGRWFFGEIEAAQARLQPHMDDRYVREMDALAAATGMHPQEVRLANFFPELFHCSGFALHGTATVNGAVYHGRVLDYLKGMGLEQNAVVMIMQPDSGHAWVNCGYAGFIGSVTAMNDQHVAIGEMGGGGEGAWDGKPMAHLMREAMEKASTLEEAVDLFRRSPRTCEYYYVVSDGKTGRACGIKATPTVFEVIESGQMHPQLPSPVADTIIMSAGDRYRELARRVAEGTGTFTAETARDLMTRPVCMGSNIQSVLFAPQSLDFWVANADSKNVASHTRFTHYNLRQLLDSAKAIADQK